MACVYLITNRATGERYVGCTLLTAARRWMGHVTHSRTGDRPLYQAIREYGRNSFDVKELSSGISLDEARRLEVKTISELHPEYNCTKGGESATLGHSHSEQTKDKISVANSGENHWAWGKSLNEEERQKLSDSSCWKKGYQMPEEQREARRERALDRNFNKINSGRKFTAEHKANLAAAARARHARNRAAKEASL